MPEVEFSEGGVDLRLSKEEWWFLTSALAYAMRWRRPGDADFRTTLMMTRAEAEQLVGDLEEAERRARTAGNHWSPFAPARNTGPLSTR
jgi:hypothetical protein